MLLSRFCAELVFHLWLQDSFLMKVIKNNSTSLRYVPTKLPFGSFWHLYLATLKILSDYTDSKDTKKRWLVLPSFFPGFENTHPENQHDNGTKATIYHLFLWNSPTQKPQIFLSLPCCHVSLEVFFTMPPEKKHFFVTRSALCQPNLRKSWFASSASEP